MGAASLVGAPRILQADGMDSIYPGVDFFEKGYIMQIMILSEATSLFLLLLWDLIC